MAAARTPSRRRPGPSGAPLGRLGLKALLLAALACTASRPTAVPAPAPQPTPELPPARPLPPSPQPDIAPAPSPAEADLPTAVGPEVSVGLAVGARGVRLGGEGPQRVTNPAGQPVVDLPADGEWRAVPEGRGIALIAAGGIRVGPEDQLVVSPLAPARWVRVDGRNYRGVLLLSRDRNGLTVVNRLPLEGYVAGVISAEMGRRAPEEQAALESQAVVTRTYARRNAGRWRDLGFDYYATVADQVYGGRDSETPQGLAAVRQTQGQILTWGGEPIDAFFYSTCGGVTAEGTEVFRNAKRPYLRSIRDEDGRGEAYCRASPRFRWQEQWTARELAAILEQTLPAEGLARAGSIGPVADVLVRRRTGSGRAAEVVLELRDRHVSVEGPAIRRVLRTTGGIPLRSNAFTLRSDRAAGRLERLVAEGGGAGHGVGFCQWGAVGRARAGHDYRAILAAYYPGTTLERMAPEPGR